MNQLASDLFVAVMGMWVVLFLIFTARRMIFGRGL